MVPVTSRTLGREMLGEWMLDPDVTYLNHGTVGAVPCVVLAAQQAIRDRIERRPSQMLLRHVSHLADPAAPGQTDMRVAASGVATRLGGRGDDLAFVDNATAGLNIVLRAIAFQPGDQILLTDHAYPTTALLADVVARQTSAAVRRVTVPYPRFDPAELIERFRQAITPETRVAIVEHVTSESALILPLAEIAACCREHGVLVLADGAHAPGMLALDLDTLGVDWYAGNLHKWAYAPRSCGILWARRDRQSTLHPPLVSWGFGQGFPAEFDWVGTRDCSPWLAAPAAFDFMERLGVEDVRRYNHALAWKAAVHLTDLWGTPLERSESSVGSMATIPLPESLGATGEEAARLRTALLVEDAIEAQVNARHDRLWLRVSAQIYNDWSDIERLAAAILRRATPSFARPERRPHAAPRRDRP
jgi:isopenicillin-N epimerase